MLRVLIAEDEPMAEYELKVAAFDNVALHRSLIPICS